MLDLLEERISSDSKLVTFLNPYSYMLASKNKHLFANFRIEIDGIILVLLLRIVGLSVVKRKSFDMTSLAPIVFLEAVALGKTIFFVGAKPGVIEEAVENIQREFSGLDIVGHSDGYFDDSKKQTLLFEITTLNPDIVVCGMGTPLQEEFLVQLCAQGWRGEGYTCGGFFHQTADGIQYYPNWINRCNLRAFYRLYREPALYKRYLIDYPRFVFSFFRDVFIWKIKRQ